MEFLGNDLNYCLFFQHNLLLKCLSILLVFQIILNNHSRRSKTIFKLIKSIYQRVFLAPMSLELYPLLCYSAIIGPLTPLILQLGKGSTMRESDGLQWTHMSDAHALCIYDK